MAAATLSAASQQKSGSQSLVSMSQECGLKLMVSLEFGKLASRGYEVIGIRQACHGPASPPSNEEGFSVGLIIGLEEQIWLSRDPAGAGSHRWAARTILCGPWGLLQGVAGAVC